MSRRIRKEKCNKYRKGQEQQYTKEHGMPSFRVIEGGSEISRARAKAVTITPRNYNQDELLAYLLDDTVDIVLAIGPAGTGKTMISTLAAIQAMKKQEVDRIVITRPAVSVDEQHGFLPGTLIEKMAPWVRPMMDVFEEYYTPDQINFMINDGKIEIAPLAYMRGRTFHDSFIIADELQLSTPNQMKMLMSRIGNNSKLVITGDLEQADRGTDNGLRDVLHRLQGQSFNEIKVVQFDKGDIERNPVIKQVLSLYGDE